MLVGLAASLKIALANIVLTIAFVVWATALLKGQARWRPAAIYWPTLAWLVASVLSGLLSADPRRSLAEQGGILTLAVVPMVVSLLTGRRWHRLLAVLAAIATLSAIVGLVQVARGASSLDHRLHGLANHYTTFAGWTLVVTLLLIGDIVCSRDRRRLLWTVPAAVICSAALVLGLTRGAWIGLATGVVLAALLIKPRILVFLPMFAMVLALALPREILDRAASTFDLGQESTRERVGMLRTGRDMLRDHPAFGVGPELLQSAYPDYRVEGAPERVPHLHNNVVQIAAERGVIGLSAYLAMLAVFTVHAYRVFRRPDSRSRPVVAGCMLAVMGVTIAGLFEYNWGDAEVWILTLACLAVPYAPVATEPS